MNLSDVRGQELYRAGLSALASQDQGGALQYFKMAW